MLREWLLESRVLPVITPGEVAVTVQLCRTLAAAGMKAVELTLRSPTALEAMRAVVAEVPQLRVAAGTVLTPAQLDQVQDAGAAFAVSPGATPALYQASRTGAIPLLPGVATASEVMAGLEQGLDCFKLFPATALGGQGLLKALAGPFPEARFCPTGGLRADNFRTFLALPNVICCGGSWMVAADLVAAGDWDAIGALAAEAMRIGSAPQQR
ncbi:bifunctional 4-hydroxy-2-oxoglutarate aldolase/2-dehydro-3-deoxy-phosphogluconate aldolase [Haliea sp. E1-2-M8]|uniref:bifunctional 4-hydroxy-2-oxoglutarate aldolase/2-dehydro-3-deoxy-phosphogluconate aldolase n=1 Tax=Haliea sp. E1-2-M8 TaxID=3064706 RepID=UPI002717ADA9|nr:bifunctional 4-hydroxy-2-oxoglutarate aldolase/2-dehydro-3-deoxy-phosphogluconate aldolase [Haliea sp. E1-2-M8]MDO8861272.1 bifunctional 4-hydroxy-2-oxoglutarate aldolase/2-dehydro-3-deoxy-phosphogluconate aldolase [Haliea sp. E1-2-M8]